MIALLLAAGLQESFVEVTDESKKSVDRGLAWLATRQKSSGEFGNGRAPMATTALCGLAFLAAGHGPGRSEYGPIVEKALAYVLSHQRNGYYNEGAGTSRGSGGSGLHGHGYATLFVAEAFGMMDDEGHLTREQVRDSLVEAVRLIEKSQSPQGGWYYEPTQKGDEGSVTITQVKPLRAARNAGIQVDTKVVEKAVDYIKKSTNANGQVRYSLTTSGHTTPTLTAAGMSVWTSLGIYDEPRIQKGLDFLAKGSLSAHSSYFYYGNFYATLAMYEAGKERWRTWFPRLRDELVKKQNAAGAWSDAEGASYGAEFATGLALLMLEVPYRYLPILQRPED